MRIFPTKLLFFIFLFVSSSSFSQVIEKHSRVKINLIGRDYNDLTKIGIETDHGIIATGRHFISDFSTSELSAIKSAGFEYDTLIDDVASYYAAPNRKSELDLYNKLANRTSSCKTGGFDFSNYATPTNYKEGTMAGYFKYEELIDALDEMYIKFPNLISERGIIDTTRTHDGYQLMYVKVSDNPSQNEVDEPEILYTALHHAREANSLSQMIFYLWYLLENYETDPLIKNIVDNTQMYFIPCVNPDGYLINQREKPNGGGLWRKNAFRDQAGALTGVDLNRNYGLYWGFDDQGSSPLPSSLTYRGTGPFSEPETRAIRNFCDKHKFSLALNYHTFGNFLIHPWGFGDDLPPDNKVFKSIAKVMAKQNNFLVGTGIETVGYTVNGDSDDWMYGEETSKPKILAMTPEVGYSFWPAQVDIDYLNKSCVWMNITNAALALNFFETEEPNGSDYLSVQNNIMTIKTIKAGLKTGSAIISLTSTTPGVTVSNPTRPTLSMVTGQDTSFNFVINVDATLTYSDGIDFTLSTDMEGTVIESSINKRWIKQDLAVQYFNAANDLSDFKALGSWNTTDVVSYSAPTCITDSPGVRYSNNTSNSITTKTPISLENVDVALLSFRAMWDIEKGYDYVVVSVSTDNVNFVPVCGKYSTLGGVQQLYNTPIYDGKQSTWVLEEIDLHDYIGAKELYIAFNIGTDGGFEADGFYFDDLLVTVGKETSATSDQMVGGFSIVPNVLKAGHSTRLVTNISKIDDEVVIENIDGKMINVVSQGANLEIPDNLVSGMYFVSLMSNGKKISTQKIAIID
jgi:carboxypeptidase T